MLTSLVAKRAATCCWSAERTLTHSTPFSRMTALLRLERLMQTRSVGGSSVTAHTAEAVQPARPAAPSEVITLTDAPRPAMASRKVVLLIMLAPDRISDDVSNVLFKAAAIRRGGMRLRQPRVAEELLAVSAVAISRLVGAALLQNGNQEIDDIIETFGH